MLLFEKPSTEKFTWNRKLVYFGVQRKFTSQTSDNMDRWKSRGGKSQRREEQKREDQRRERVRRKKMQVREKVGKSRNSLCFFSNDLWLRRVEKYLGSLKRRARSHLARWEMKSCTPVWREAHLEVKTHTTPHVRTTFGSWDLENVHAVVARSTFGSQNVHNTSFLDDFWKLRCRKRARRCGAKHMSKSKVQRTEGYRALLDV